MNQNACKHLAGVVEEYKKFNADFQHCIYDIGEEDDFINEWNRMLDSMDYVTIPGYKGCLRKGSNGH